MTDNTDMSALLYHVKEMMLNIDMTSDYDMGFYTGLQAVMHRVELTLANSIEGNTSQVDEAINRDAQRVERSQEHQSVAGVVYK